MFNLKATQFLLSFSIDFMHLIYKNIASYMFKFWTEKFFSNNNVQDNSDYILNESIWKEIGIEIDRIRKIIPAYIG